MEGEDFEDGNRDVQIEDGLKIAFKCHEDEIMGMKTEMANGNVHQPITE